MSAPRGSCGAPATRGKLRGAPRARSMCSSAPGASPPKRWGRQGGAHPPRRCSAGPSLALAAYPAPLPSRSVPGVSWGSGGARSTSVPAGGRVRRARSRCRRRSRLPAAMKRHLSDSSPWKTSAPGLCRARRRGCAARMEARGFVRVWEKRDPGEGGGRLFPRWVPAEKGFGLCFAFIFCARRWCSQKQRVWRKWERLLV